MTATIKEAKTAEELMACWPVLKTLYPYLAESTFLDTIDSESVVVAILGYRIQNYLFSGKTLYIDDLCSLPTARGKGNAGALLDHVVEIGKVEKCNTVSLDSEYDRNDAHRLYLNKKFKLCSHHFTLNLK